MATLTTREQHNYSLPQSITIKALNITHEWWLQDEERKRSLSHIGGDQHVAFMLDDLFQECAKLKLRIAAKYQEVLRNSDAHQKGKPWKSCWRRSLPAPPASP